jgi:hypothetical protein
MFCPNCGSPNPETAARCGSCGTSVSTVPAPAASMPPAAAAYPTPGTGPTAPVPNHLVFAIVITAIGAMSCLPVAIAGGLGIYYATQVNSKLALGDVPGAMEASKHAKTASMVGVIMTVVAIIAMIGLVAFAIAAESM